MSDLLHDHALAQNHLFCVCAHRKPAPLGVGETRSPAWAAPMCGRMGGDKIYFNTQNVLLERETTALVGAPQRKMACLLSASPRAGKWLQSLLCGNLFLVSWWTHTLLVMDLGLVLC